MSVRGYLLLVGVMILALIAVEMARPKPLDLRVRLEREGDAPFDAEVFYESLPAWLGQPVEPVAVPAFELFADTTLRGRTYLVLAQSVAPDAAEAERVLDFVARGNTLALLTHGLSGPLADALMVPDTTEAEEGVLADGDLGVYEEPEAIMVDPVFGGVEAFGARAEFNPDTLTLVPPGVAGDYAFPIDVQLAEIVGLDPARTEVLGHAVWPWEETERMVTLVRVRHGRGEVLISSTPLAVSNAALTGAGDGPAYAAALVASLPDQPVLWDDYLKPYQEHAATPLRYVLQTPALRGAYVVLLLAGVLYLAFRGRRWQRAVPVVAPPPNAQREFARTVGRLRFVHRDDRALARRMERVVLDRLRTELRITEPALDDDTARLAAARAGVPEDEAQQLFGALRRARQRPDAHDLVRLDARVARFFRHV
ncbi:DUF4350 domain-containing protein [Rubrivirga marina]|uniref:DUF4350 domain-containing protein n=1 Tax=Rubrivirga marina TaxID=1196024 RepID=A0A271J358_9BACT|nr:DUF4350 domain-containing protein [Rubrivirga marina]PAP77961.1 hypothetical protein BSZ37_16705 [Rubrivirga marina]